MKYKTSLEIESGPLGQIQIIDQRYLPHREIIAVLKSGEDAFRAIREMWVRGAPLIGVTAAFGMYLAAKECPEEEKFINYIFKWGEYLKTARPTAVNLSWAIEQSINTLNIKDTQEDGTKKLLQKAVHMREEDIEACRSIGLNGEPLIRKLHESKGRTVNILTHCNAGRMACIDHGTATSPIYEAHRQEIPIHVWVDETRPRNQGAITSWELSKAGIPNTVITDNAGGLLMQKGMVDLVIVGSDRASMNGDAANKIGTYLKALAAREHQVPFYVALPGSTFDPNIWDGVRDIPIEERDANEILRVKGLLDKSEVEIQLYPEGTQVRNFGFDVTPAKLISGFITERGLCNANPQDIGSLFPEFQPIA